VAVLEHIRWPLCAIIRTDFNESIWIRLDNKYGKSLVIAGYEGCYGIMLDCQMVEGTTTYRKTVSKPALPVTP